MCNVEPAAEVVETMAARGVLGGVPYSRLAPGSGMDDVLLLCATETNTDADIGKLASALKEALA